MLIVDPDQIAKKQLAMLKESVAQLNSTVMVVGFIASDDPPSFSYAKATRKEFTNVGFNYDLRKVKRLNLEAEIIKANADEKVHGIFIYFPVFKNQEDTYLRNLVHYTKDIEAGSLYWTRKLNTNDRSATSKDTDKKALIPCTPLAIVKVLDEIGEYGTGTLPLLGKTVTIFNRSEVIGRPLAVMMSNDGARVLSFDENGPIEFTRGTPRETNVDRAMALGKSHMVITGVPELNFERIKPQELRADVICLNFSSENNYCEAIESHVRAFVPRIGPMTVAMCMRNTIRLFENFHSE